MEAKEEQSNKEKFESEQNLLGVFAILLAVDKRLNPENYKLIKPKEND